MKFFDELLPTLPDGRTQDILMGAFWTVVTVEVNGQQRCGLASTLRNEDHHHGSGPDVAEAGRLLAKPARQLAELVYSESRMEAAIGMATINALLPTPQKQVEDRNADRVIAEYGAGKQVALIGHFPFIPWVRERVGQLWVLEQQPKGEDLPAEAASDIIPRADLVAMTSTTLINHTFDGLIELCRPETVILLLGPSTPLSPLLFDYGIDFLSGSVVENIEAVWRAVGQGANFRQVRRYGVRLVTMQPE